VHVLYGTIFFSLPLMPVVHNNNNNTIYRKSYNRDVYIYYYHYIIYIILYPQYMFAVVSIFQRLYRVQHPTSAKYYTRFAISISVYRGTSYIIILTYSYIRGAGVSLGLCGGVELRRKLSVVCAVGT